MIIVPTESTKLHTPTIQPYYLKSFQKMQFESDTHIYEIMNDKVYKMKVLETINDHKLDGNGEVDVNLMFHLKNENVEKTLGFKLILKPWAAIYEPCWVILGSCCRPMHTSIHH